MRIAAYVRAAALVALLIGLHSTSGAQAADFSKGSNAEEIGLTGEEKAMFSGKVVDILCELAGDCPKNCGDGRRNLGILRSADNVLVIVAKNSQFEFNGGVDDMLPHCNQDVEVDGLLIGEDPGFKAKIYMAQFIRKKGEKDWIKTTRWTKAWSARNPSAATGEEPWFRRDPRVLKQIEQSGYFGLGKEVDEKWRKANQ